MENNIFFFVLVGFVAQAVDGALGMAYGVTSNSILLSLGVTPAAASASVHFAEVVTTAVSGLSHYGFGNVNKMLFKRLIIPGVIGGVIGAYLLSNIDGSKIKVFVSVYLIIIGLTILIRAFKKPVEREVNGIGFLTPLGLTGGFFDAIGGGGWGPIVTSTLVASGNHPRYTIGSVNASEFFVTTAESITFFLALGVMHWKIVLGLLIGGVIAAPMAAFLCKRIPQRMLMLMVGLLITGLSIRTIILTL
jgi:uncharacterized membrane protein YfcA